MADKKISELQATTSVSTTDVLPIVQNLTTNKITVGTLFSHVPGDIKYSGVLASLTTPETITSGAVSVLTPITFVSNETGIDITTTLANGSCANFEKTIIASTLTTNKVLVTCTGAGFTTLSFNSIGASAKLIFTNNKWYILSLHNVTSA